MFSIIQDIVAYGLIIVFGLFVLYLLFCSFRTKRNETVIYTAQNDVGWEQCPHSDWATCPGNRVGCGMDCAGRAFTPLIVEHPAPSGARTKPPKNPRRKANYRVAKM